jgi:hypothetical protein
MKYDSRLKKLEKSIDEIKGFSTGFRYVFRNPDETEEQCLERHGLDGDFPGITVYIFKWGTGEPEKPGIQNCEVKRIAGSKKGG